jgi:hypothetical protein
MLKIAFHSKIKLNKPTIAGKILILSLWSSFILNGIR